MKLECEWTFAI